MKHEVINSVGVVTTPIISLFTAWHQFSPKSDTITLASDGRLETGSALEVQPFGAPNLESGKSQPVIGPVTWKLRVHNFADKAVSIVGFDAFLLSDDGSPIQYSSMKERLLRYSPAMEAQSLPEKIPPNESRAYLVSLHVPFVSDEDKKCGETEKTWHDLERCFFQNGRDPFGNKVTHREFSGGGFMATMDEAFKGPRFVVLLETADGSVFSTQISFLPGGL
ncbi:hypothetical protein [Tropicibacter sp. Alg240-R139]|uniref:hypothetical protein n=1 Tax=Tropicibacter sp. Alg240-R139 TaxID=2305991 RepID=UPI0013E06A66|nr:hypothetical protein [Tropicibacter sp. Alg240-R139]